MRLAEATQGLVPPDRLDPQLGNYTAENTAS